MGKLNIAHHKSYHPYRLDNIERVRRDEEEARLKEAKEEGRMALADAEARIALLRERAGVNDSKKKKSRRAQEKEEEKLIAAGNLAIAPTSAESKSGPTTSSLGFSGEKHINLFEDLEQQTMSNSLQSQSAALQKAKASNEEKGVALAPSQKDLNPWYSSAPKLLPDPNSDPLNASHNEEDGANPEESNRDRDRRMKGSVDGKGVCMDDPEFRKEHERRARDMTHKAFNDPMKEVESYLKRREEGRKEEERRNRYRHPPPRPDPPSQSTSSTSTSTSDPPNALASRLTRESSERARALELIARRKREAAGSVMSTPVSVHGGGYGDVFNKRETEDAFNSRRRGRGYSGGGWGERERDRRDGERKVRW